MEVPVGDVFCNGWCEFSQVSSLPVAVNPNGGFNSHWQLSFRSDARITVDKTGTDDMVLYYQVTYALTEVPEDRGYLHTQSRPSNPLPYQQVHMSLDGVQGLGHCVVTYVAWGVSSNGRWGRVSCSSF